MTSKKRLYIAMAAGLFGTAVFSVAAQEYARNVQNDIEVYQTDLTEDGKNVDDRFVFAYEPVESGDEMELASEDTGNLSGEDEIVRFGSSIKALGFTPRGDAIPGLRMKASIAATVKTVSDPDVRFGFIATRQKIMEDYLLDDAKLTFALPDEVAYISVDAYVKKNGKVITDRTIDCEDGVSVFANLLLNEYPATQSAYTSVMAVRPYVMIGDVVLYGEVSRYSLYDAVKTIDKADIEANAFYRNVIAVCEGSEAE